MKRLDNRTDVCCEDGSCGFCYECQLEAHMRAEQARHSQIDAERAKKSAAVSRAFCGTLRPLFKQAGITPGLFANNQRH